MLINEFIETKNIDCFLKEKMVPLIEEELEKQIKNIKNEYIQEALNYCLKGGKKLRPTLCVLTAKCYNIDINLSIIPAISCEVLHNSLLIHDDLIDGDEIRRNKPTIWKKYGKNQAINIGDFSIILTYKILEEYPNTIQREKMFRYTNETYLKTFEGQILEEIIKEKNDPSIEEYFEMVSKKTGYYLVYPIILGLIISEKEEEINKILKFGKYFGILYQIQDDLIDLTEGKGRGDIGNDIKEGKRSIFIVDLLNKVDEKTKKEIIDILNKPRNETTSENIEKIIKLFNKYKVFENIENIKNEYLIKAKKELNHLENENLKKVLNKFLEYTIIRER